jgi:hypothetical protein
MPSDFSRPRRHWHLAAVLAFAVAAPLNMWGWVEKDVIPLVDHAGYIAAVQQLWNNLAHYGRVPTWLPDQLGGSSHFTSSLKEFLALPFVAAFGPTHGYFAVLALCKVLAAVSLYAVFAALFRSPAVGLVAGYAYGFGAIGNYRSGLLGNLDILLSYAIYPLVLVAAVRSLRAQRRSWAVGLGTLVALQLHVSLLSGLLLPLMIALLWAMRPWRPPPEARTRCRTEGGLRQQTRSLSLAVGVFALLSASQTAWLAFDAENHALHVASRVEQGREHFVVQSPFLLVNRGNWLGPWLAEHGPEVLRIDADRSLHGQRLYLGGVALAGIAVAAVLLGRAPTLRRWYGFFGVFFSIQYWLAMGSYTLLGQLAEGFRWTPPVERWTCRALLAAAAVCAIAGAWRGLRLRDPIVAKRLLWAAVGAVAVCTSAFDAAESVLPLLRGIRAPDHFFDLAPFAFYAWFGVSLAVIERGLPRPVLRHGFLVLTALLVIADYAPSRAAHGTGMPMTHVRGMADTLRSLESEQPPARLGITIRSRTNRTHSSLIAALAEASTAWSWVGWQGGRYWYDFYLRVHLGLVSRRGDDAPADVRDALARIARVRYVLQELAHRERVLLPPPWRVVASNDRFVLWEQPEIHPPAMGLRAYLLSLQNAPEQELAFSERMLPHGVAVVSVSDLSSSAAEELFRGASFFHAPLSAEPLLDPRHRQKLQATTQRLRSMDIEPRSRIEVQYTRPAPEHITLELDAGGGDALAFVSESYHPWWRARVDDEPAPLIRAMSTFMAVKVGPGEHRVDLAFRRPAPVWAADWLSRASWVATLAGLLACTAASGFARRREAGPGGSS